MAQITYADKVALNTNSQIADINKTTASDMNEIKSVVNENDTNVGNLANLNTADKSSVVNAINSMFAKSLYSSSNYSTNIKLDDDAQNYKYFVIRMTANVYSPANIKEEDILVVNPDGKECSHSILWYNNTNNQLYGGQIIFTISGNSLTINSNVIGTVGANNAYFTNDGMVKIVEVLGYK